MMADCMTRGSWGEDHLTRDIFFKITVSLSSSSLLPSFRLRTRAVERSLSRRHQAGRHPAGDALQRGSLRELLTRAPLAASKPRAQLLPRRPTTVDRKHEL